MPTIVSAATRVSGTFGNDFIFVRSLDSVANGGAGNDVIVGDYGPAVRSTGFFNLDNPNLYSTDLNPLVTDRTIPHTTIAIEPFFGDPWVEFTITVSDFEHLVLDIDYAGSGVHGGEPVDAFIEIFDSSGLLVSDDDAPLDIGSDSTLDSFLDFTAGFADTYTIRVSPLSGDFDGDEEFLLHLSRDGVPGFASVPVGDDLLLGAAGADDLFGVGGNDTLRGGSGDDRLYGGFGVDWASFSDATGGVIVNLTAGVARARAGGNAGNDQLFGMEAVAGSRGSDSIIGNDLDNTVVAGVGNDTVRGVDGNDTLSGGDGNDLIAGGRGADVLTTGAGEDVVLVRRFDGREEVLDFRDGADLLDLRTFNLTASEVLDITRATSRGTFIDLPSADGVLLVGFAIADFDRFDVLL